MKILVTGANGYIGQGIVKQLIQDGAEVIATDLSSEYIDNGATIKEADIFTLENPFEYFDCPDVVLHLAWKNGFIHNHISHIEELPSHYIFLKKLVEAGIKQIAIMGSMHEVGFFEGSINESTPTHPQSLYGISKNALRESIELLSKNSGCIFQWIRGFYIVGNTECGCSIFSKITMAANRKDVDFPFTSGQNQWDFLDYDEFCYQTSKVIEQSNITGIINVCSGKPEKLADRVEKFILDNHYKIKLKYGSYPDRPYDSKAVWGDDSKIKKILNNQE